MTTLFWVLIVLHVFLCFFLALLVLVQNDKMGGLAGLGGMTSQSAFSTAGAATFIQKLTRVVAVIFFIVVFALGLITAKQDQVVEESTMQKATRENASEQAVPEIPALPATFNAPAEAAPAAPAAAEVKAEAAPAAVAPAAPAPAAEAAPAAPAEAPKAKKGKKKAAK
ncbi:preprotein translocase subunit SecG [Fibrobacter succinogenes]|uniref:preprotein translocase subunit SecG n=1 Tax=Fibrobacter succinogenes TaxID=833 RepID=UPI00156992C2|nr:preprotein translocase subunit SecG [Fibrobacter succinogenes]